MRASLPPDPLRIGFFAEAKLRASLGIAAHRTDGQVARRRDDSFDSEYLSQHLILLTLFRT